MKRLMLTACAACAMFLAPSAATATGEFVKTTIDDVRSWVQTRGEAEAKDEVVEVDLVFNFMKGVGCSDEDAQAAADAAAARASELLKGACVTLNVKEVNNDWEGPGNMGAGADGEVDEAEMREAKASGLMEVTGDDGNGGTKKGYKVFIVKDFTGDLDGTAGVTIKCEPWTAVKKMVENTEIGETLAHEIGHSFGKLDDTYDEDNDQCLMYGYVEEDSMLKLKEGEGDKIRDGAKGHGRTVEADDKAEEAPKTERRIADGSTSRSVDFTSPLPAGEAGYANVVATSFAGEGTDTIVEFEIVRDLSSTAPTFIHLGLDLDGDPATGQEFGPLVGVETVGLIQYDPVSGDAFAQLQDLVGGLVYEGPMTAMPSALVLDAFDAPGGAALPLRPINEVIIGGVIPHAAFPLVVGPAPANAQVVVSPLPDPAALPLPQVDVFQFPILPDDFLGRPRLVAPGVALPGQPLPLDGFGFPPNVPLTVCVDTQEVATVNSGPLGQFTLPVPVPPVIAEPSDYAVITVKPAGPGASGFTWVGVGAPCPADLDGDGFVGPGDLGILLAAWGQPTGPDLDGDGFVGPGDLGILLAAWGPCP